MFGYISENVVKNILWCLVVWLKMLFSYNNKNQNHTESTFSHIFSPVKQIYNFIPQFRNTNKTQEKKKNHNPVKLREEGREGGRLVLGCDDRDRGRRIWVRDRGR